MRNAQGQRTHQHDRAGNLIASLPALRDRLINLRPTWLPLVLLVPVLYGLGWVMSAPLLLFGIDPEQHALIGTVFSFLLLMMLLPRWCRLRWQSRNSWRSLGLSGGGRRGRPQLAPALLRGLGIALLLLAVILLLVLTGSWGHWLGEWSLGRSLNALALAFGVGLAEELIFRGWLWQELELLFGSSSAIAGQAIVFSVIHTRFNLGLMPMLGLLIGLFLLGLCLAMLRRLDGGSLWGCVGLHGGLVGGWFLLQNGLLQLSPDAPAWLVGPGGMSANPLGGAVAISTLLGLLLLQRTAVARASSADAETETEA